jgi:predicted ATPase/DNA-binding CsgD family transcriptional regulator
LQGAYTLHDTRSQQVLAVAPDSHAWCDWLASIPSFTFSGQHGHLTVRQETRSGGSYWYAYHRVGEKMAKRYLGRTTELTPARLEQVAARLATDGDAVDADTAAVPSSRASLPRTTPPLEQAAEFPPPFPRGVFSRTCAALPTYLTPLLGREQDVQTVSALLARQEVRLVTLTGPGGVGKTRLAVQVASHLQGTFADGICFVSLASLSDPDLVCSTLAQALDLPEPEQIPLLEHLERSLREKHLLLLLDNFEQIVSAAPLVGELLATCPAVKALVTSRTGLRLPGEYEFPVSPLALPSPTYPPDAGALAQYAAVALFAQRASAIKPSFSLTDDNAATIAAICARLDGLPLAIELAASRIKLLQPPAILARLHRRLDLLTGGARGLPARQQTLRNTLQWSYDLLPVREQRLFRRLSVFAGSFTFKAAEAVCDAPGDRGVSILDGVASLVEHSLLQPVEQAGDEPRFLMLETIREYGLACLEATGETVPVKDAYAGSSLALAEEAAPKLASAEQGQWLARLEQEQEHLRAALGWSLERQDRLSALRLAAALWRFWFIRGHLSEGRTWLEQVLALGEESLEPAAIRAARANMLVGAAILMGYQGEYRQARRFGEESLALFRDLGDQRGMAAALGSLGLLARFRHDYAQARALYEQSLALLRELDDRWGIAQTLSQFVRTFFLDVQPDYTTAFSLCEESLVLFRELGDRQGAATVQVSQGFLAYRQGDYLAARALMNECLPFFREIGDRHLISRALSILGSIAQAQGHFADAQTFSHEALPLLQALGDQWGIAMHLLSLAGVAAGLGQLVWAARLLGTSAAFYETLGVSHPPTVQAWYDYTVATVRARLSEEPFAAAWRVGREITLEQVLVAPEQVTPVEHAAPEPFQQPGSLVPAAPTTLDELTAREVEVLRLLAQGLTNAQMAQRLVISPRTIHAHVRAIYSKLGLPSRVAATHYALEHHVLSSSFPDHA